MNSPTRMSGAMTLLFAVAGGAAVSNLYWAQPLLAQIAESLGVPVGRAGLLVTMTQLGYALGVLLIVPLGDMLDRRRLIPAIILASAVALAGCALAPSFGTLLLALAAVGMTTVAGQLLTPLAGDLAASDQRGKVVGTVASGLLIGILLSRTISGLVADLFGWRAVFVLALALTLVVGLLVARYVPSDARRPRVPYFRLVGSVFGIVRSHPPVQVIMALGVITFAVFTMFWTAITFLLSAPPFNYGVTAIGATSLVGLAGAVAAQRAGKLYDQGHSVVLKGAGLATVLLGLAIAAAGTTSIVLLLVAALLVSAAIQVVNVLNQTRIFEVDPASRSRLNTAFVVGNFLGGAVGSALAGLLWTNGGWLAVTAVEAGLTLAGLLIWYLGRRLLAPIRLAGTEG